MKYENIRGGEQMRGVVTAAEMKALDANTIEKAGIPSLVLMERAALQTVTEIIKRVNTKDRENPGGLRNRE